MPAATEQPAAKKEREELLWQSLKEHIMRERQKIKEGKPYGIHSLYSKLFQFHSVERNKKNTTMSIIVNVCLCSFRARS